MIRRAHILVIAQPQFLNIELMKINAINLKGIINDFLWDLNAPI